ncbi:hypothetical protein P154DRAFT_244755 [Amniculicola lignicola CBS 123094]|uniref:Uncharacterized protein n=1 Tax=Amniculicola lignicola CBS 123094 TaxID=1392246 RepID=A0A6A5WDE4_9PLEO|nr:hypothetical protein P154DRAFT_244755 [Amniculicola lignicola CBS 123094]
MPVSKYNNTDSARYDISDSENERHSESSGSSSTPASPLHWPLGTPRSPNSPKPLPPLPKPPSAATFGLPPLGNPFRNAPPENSPIQSSVYPSSQESARMPWVENSSNRLRCFFITAYTWAILMTVLMIFVTYVSIETMRARYHESTPTSQMVESDLPETILPTSSPEMDSSTTFADIQIKTAIKVTSTQTITKPTGSTTSAHSTDTSRTSRQDEQKGSSKSTSSTTGAKESKSGQQKRFAIPSCEPWHRDTPIVARSPMTGFRGCDHEVWTSIITLPQNITLSSEISSIASSAHARRLRPWRWQ